jgi:hypothetical protein
MADLSEHINTLITLLGVGWTVAGIIGWKFFWSFLTRIEKKLDEQQSAQAKCQAELPEKYVQWMALTGPEGLVTEIRNDRRIRWREYDRHRHEPVSGAVISD